MAMKVKVIKDVTVYDGNKTYGKGAIFDYHGGEKAVAKLIEMGIVEKASAAPSPVPEAEKPVQTEGEDRPKPEKPKK
jgi:hypothetical protein